MSGLPQQQLNGVLHPQGPPSGVIPGRAPVGPGGTDFFTALQNHLRNGGGNPQTQQHIASLLAPHFPQLQQLAEAGRLTPQQRAQVANLQRIYNATRLAQSNTPVSSTSLPPAIPAHVQNRLPPTNALGLTATPSMIVASASAANPASTSAATSNGVATGQKRKTPPTDISNTHNPNANNSNNNTTTFTTNNNSTNTPTMISASPHFEISANLEVPNPGPQPWPNAIGPRPSLSGGLASGSVLMGTPAFVQRVTDGLDLIDAANVEPGSKKDPLDIQGKKTIKDVIASIDPSIQVDPEVEDLLLNAADEFIDSITHFACQLAKHRGSDTLDVKDLQLHLERNYNIRIPGFSSDEVRISISQANADAALIPTKHTSSKGSSSKSKDKDKDGKEKPGHRDGATLRASRLAAVRHARSEKVEKGEVEKA